MKLYLFQMVIVLALIFGTGKVDWAQVAPPSISGPNASVLPAGPVFNGLALSAITDKQVYIGGEAIELKIAFVNPTASYQYYAVMGSASPFALFDFDVQFADEEKVAFSAFGQRSLKRVLGTHSDPLSVFSLSVAPGKSLTYRVVLSRLFDMSRGGTYRIAVRCHDPLGDVVTQQSQKHSPFVSNHVVVRVEEPSSDFYGGNTIFHH